MAMITDTIATSPNSAGSSSLARKMETMKAIPCAPILPKKCQVKALMPSAFSVLIGPREISQSGLY